ncbi:MAG: hypothetical protein GYA87_03890, partial [Christensenellaceae bacterium]|nr:hypothetical protein [Christensenellaceae bacterium]
KLGNVEEDVPLLSFNAIKNVLKKQIDAGQLRVIDEMQFGYLPFLKNNDNMETYILHPVWRILGSYTYDVNKENVLPYYEEDGSKSCPQEYYNYFYSAQTGEMIQAANLTHNSLPLQSIDYIAWGDIKAND